MKWKPYPKYKDSGVEWLGSVPTEWDVLPAKRLLEYVTSGARDWGGRYADHGATLLRIGNVPREGIDLDLSDMQYVKPPEGLGLARTRVKAGDIVVSITADLGSVAWISDTVEGAYVSQHLALCRPAPGICSRWIAYAMRGDAGRAQLSVSGYGGTKIQLSLSDVRDVLVALPCAEEQRRIAAFLDIETARIDTLIAKQERLIALLQEKRQALISHAVTKGLNPDAPMKPTDLAWLGTVPAHWTLRRTSAVFHPVSEPGNEELPTLSVSISSGVADEERNTTDEGRKIIRGKDKTAYQRVLPGDIVYNMMRAWQGGIGLVRVLGQVSPAYVVLRPTKALCGEYFEYLLRTSLYNTQLTRYSKGVTSFRWRLYWDDFKSVPLMCPPIDEQHAIADYLQRESERFDAIVKSCERSIALMRERRAALISAAVTGKIDVRDVGETAHA